MLDYITERSGTFIADALIESKVDQDAPEAAVLNDPFEAVSVFMDDFSSTDLLKTAPGRVGRVVISNSDLLKRAKDDRALLRRAHAGLRAWPTCSCRWTRAAAHGAVLLLEAVHNTILLIVVVVMFCFVVALLIWNACWGSRGAIGFVNRYSDADLRAAKDGQYVKVTGNLSRIDEAKGIIDKMKEKFPNKTEGWKEVEEAAEVRGAWEDIMSCSRTPTAIPSCHPEFMHLYKVSLMSRAIDELILRYLLYWVRLSWHDAGTNDKNITEWPKCGGANGNLRFKVELKHGANAGLVNALKLIQPIKDKFSGVTYADLFQLASATTIKEAGGHKFPIIYGRVDVIAPEQCPPEGRLPV